MREGIYSLNKNGINIRSFRNIFCEGFASFQKDESAQATTEYILLLTISVSLFMILKKMLSPAFQKLTETLQSRINQAFDPKALHQFRVRCNKIYRIFGDDWGWC